MPRRYPSSTGKLRSRAQRRLPSMITATCAGIGAAAGISTRSMWRISGRREPRDAATSLAIGDLSAGVDVADDRFEFVDVREKARAAALRDAAGRGGPPDAWNFGERDDAHLRERGEMA